MTAKDKNDQPTVCLVDDDPDLGGAIRLLMKAEAIPYLHCISAREFLDLFDRESAPNIGCLLLDVRMPSTDGMQLMRTLHERKVPVPIILLTGHATISITVEAMRLGALDVIEKPFDDDELLAVVRRGLELHEQWNKKLVERSAAASRIANLTRREIEVLDLMVEGLSNEEIAKRLEISPKTLDIHRANVKEKMEAKTTGSLVRQRLLDQTDTMLLPFLYK